jgi:Putative zincin peptidase
MSILAGLRDFALALAALLVVIMPLHEMLHALAYRVIGARDIRWDYSLRLAAIWVIAHRFVAARGPFIFVALAPWLVLNAILGAIAIAWPAGAVFVIFVILWHHHGASGDLALLNFVWLHRKRGFWSFDDADSGASFFFGRRDA